MAKLNKAQQARYEGAWWMIQLIQEKGLEEAQKELEWRFKIKAPMLMLEENEILRFQRECKEAATRQVGAVALITLMDRYDWNKEQLIDFLAKFNAKDDLIADEWASWTDYKEILLDEAGIDIDKIVPSWESGKDDSI